MTRKTEQLYTAVLSSIRELIPCFIPVFAIGDFEIVPRNALKGIYPTVTIIGCWFHYTKALYEKVQKLGLTILYKKNHSFRKWIRRLMALHWLPEEEIYPVYLLLELPTTDLLEAEKNLVKAFRTYFNRTWLSGNDNLSVFYYEQATNNGAESYHKTLKSYMKIPYPNIWRFMESLNNIISDYDIEFQRLTNGLATTRGTNYNTRTKLIRRKELRENLINQTCTSLQYLDAMASTIGKENLNPAEPLTVPIDSAISHAVLDSFESEDDLNDDQCHVQSPTKSTCQTQISTHISSHLFAYHLKYTLNEVSKR